MRKQFIGTKIVAYSVTTTLTVACLMPVLLLIISSTRSTTDLLKGMTFIPGDQFFNNLDTISRADLGVNIWRAMANSLLIAGSSAIGAVYVSALTAYAIKAYPAKGNKLFFAFILGVIMLPSQLSIIGFYKYIARLKLLNNYIPLIMPAIAAPTTVFFMKEYLDSVLQLSLVEAARIDGAGEFYTFNRIIMPIMAPAIATMALISFIVSWNTFLTPYILISKMELYTSPLMTLVLNINNVTPDYGARYAGLTVSLIPILLVYLFTSKYIIRGISIGGVKE